MDKKTAINLLGGTPAKAAKALGFKSVQAIYLWADELPLAQQDRVNGAVLRMAAKKRHQKEVA
jgi:hypothetical protein